jgi:acyl-CoA thioester hydrolase
MMAIADFRCVMRFRVPFCDIDMLQHVNNAAYVVWAETIRCNYFDEVLGESLTGSYGIILAKTEFEYLHPLNYREEVAVSCRISRIRRKSFDFIYEVWSENSQSMAARGRTVMVAYNNETKASIVIPEKWREAIAAYEVVAPTVE